MIKFGSLGVLLLVAGFAAGRPSLRLGKVDIDTKVAAKQSPIPDGIEITSHNGVDHLQFTLEKDPGSEGLAVTESLRVRIAKKGDAQSPPTEDGPNGGAYVMSYYQDQGTGTTSEKLFELEGEEESISQIFYKGKSIEDLTEEEELEWLEQLDNEAAEDSEESEPSQRSDPHRPTKFTSAMDAKCPAVNNTAIFYALKFQDDPGKQIISPENVKPAISDFYAACESLGWDRPHVCDHRPWLPHHHTGLIHLQRNASSGPISMISVGVDERPLIARLSADGAQGDFQSALNNCSLQVRITEKEQPSVDKKESLLEMDSTSRIFAVLVRNNEIVNKANEEDQPQEGIQARWDVKAGDRLLVALFTERAGPELCPELVNRISASNSGTDLKKNIATIDRTNVHIFTVPIISAPARRKPIPNQDPSSSKRQGPRRATGLKGMLLKDLNQRQQKEPEEQGRFNSDTSLKKRPRQSDEQEAQRDETVVDTPKSKRPRQEEPKEPDAEGSAS